tara:strand:+ start:188 stop:1465 length:1278 start_codon:yes stop_codon:yes gene_type:complete
MYWLIENKEQLDVLINSSYKEDFIEVIPYNDTIHPSQTYVSLVYIRPLEATKGFMVGIHHSEVTNELITYKTSVETLINKFEKLYCRDKKETLHYFPNKTLHDITPPPHTYIRPTTKVHEIFYSKHKDNHELNLIIPIVKHYELCEHIFEDLKANINRTKTKYDEFFNNKVSMVFNYLERSGIRVHKETFEEHFHPIDGERVYTQYNLRTTTTRPSNKFKNVNYAALSHKNGCRKAFIPSNDRFIDIDISAYHPSLSCMLINYNFPSIDIHSHLQELYQVDYAKSKELTFKQLYGGVFKEYEHLEFFSKINIYVKELWEDFEREGKITCPISNYVYKKENLDKMNPQKLFNYLLQNLETSMNVRILWDMISVLKGKKTKLVLYTYDSFLLDADDSEQYLIEDVKKIFAKYKLNTKTKEGYDYDFK